MKKKEGGPCYSCVCCGEEYGLEDLFEFKAKGKTKRICPECADIVHGLV